MALKPKSKPGSSPEKVKIPLTFETAKAVELSENEKNKLSRERILSWYKRKKFEKLKGLQKALIDATYSEREEIKKIIMKNTKAELAKQKEIVKEEIDKRAEKFAQEIINVADGIGNIDMVIRKYEKQRLDEEIFFATLGGYVGKEKDRQLLKKMAASPQIQQIIAAVKREDSSKAREIELAMKEGDYTKVRKAIAKASGGNISEAQLNTMFAASSFGSLKFEKSTGIGILDKGIMALNVMRQVGHFTVLNAAKKDLGVPFMFVMHLSMKTLRDIQNMDENLQRNKYLIENKTHKTKLDEDRLEFINRINELRKHLDGKAAEKGMEEKFRSALDKYLATKKELTDIDKMQIRENSKFEDLRLIQIFDLVYGSPEDRDKWFIKSISRIPTMLRAHKQVFGEQRYITKTMKEYHYRKLKERAVRGFSENARRWQMGGILKEIGDVEKLIEKGAKAGQSEFDKLFKRANAYELRPDKLNDAKKLLSEEMLEHDNLVKRYHALVQQATQIMTKQTKDLLGVGRGLQKMQKVDGFASKTLNQLPHISDQSLKTLFGDLSKADKMKLRGGDLIAAYTKKMADLGSMQSITRARFSALAETIDNKVVKPFGGAWGKKIEFAQGKATRKQMIESIQEIKDMSRPTPGKYYAKRFGLPAIIVGTEMYYLATGKAKSSEVLWDLGEAAAGFCPFLGTALDIRGAIKGTTLSGKKLSTKERWMYAGFAAIGAVADVATFIGGIGLGLRASLGGVRTGRRALQVGKSLDSANSLRKMAYVKDAPFVQRQIAKVASWASKAKRADAATEAAMTAKAMDQAALIGSLSKKYEGVNDMSKLGDLIKDAEKAGDIADATKLRKLQKLTSQLTGGMDYMKVLSKYGKAVEIPKGIFGQAWYKTLSAFKKMKSKLLSLGISSDVLRSYEKSFDAVNAAKAAKTKAVADLKELYMVQHAEQVKHAEAFNILTNKASSLGKSEESYAKLVQESREGTRKLMTLAQRKKRLKEQHERLLEAKKIADKAKKAGNTPAKQVTKAELDSAEKLFKQADAAWLDKKNSLKILNKTKKQHGAMLGSKSKAWKKQLDTADKNLFKIDSQIIRKEGAVRDAEFALQNASSTRSFMQAEMMAKATEAARSADRISGVARLMQKGGLVMGGIWFLTGFKYGPAEQMEAAKKIVPKATGAAKRVGHELFIADHSGQPAIDQIVEGRVAQIKHKKTIMGHVEKAKERGEDPAMVFARNWNDDAAKELAKKHGYYDKVQKLLAEGKAKVKKHKSALQDVVSGDAVGRLRDKLKG